MAQCIHAAAESYRPPKCRDPTYAVALQASKQELEKLEMNLVRDGVDHVAIREPDMPWNGELMAVGACGQRDKLYKYFRRYKLV